MNETLARVLPLALGAAISPIILLLQVATLASPRFPVRRALIVLAANALVVVGVMAVIVTTDHRAATVPTTDDVVGAWIKIVLAVLLLAGAIHAALAPPPEEAAAPSTADAQEAVHAGRYFLLGIGAMVTNLTTIVLLIPAVHDAATAEISGSDRFAVMAVIALIVLLPSYAPLLVVAALGRRGPAVLASFGSWLRAHRRAVTVAVSLGFALYLGISGYLALA